MRDSTGASEDLLRSRLRTDGYVYLRGVLDREDVLGLREIYFRQFPRDYLKPSTTPRDGIWSGHPAGMGAHGVTGHPANTLVRSKLFARFAANPRLERLARLLLGEPEVMRMSADIRFVPITVEPDPRWLKPWSGDDGN